MRVFEATTAQIIVFPRCRSSKELKVESLLDPVTMNPRWTRGRSLKNRQENSASKMENTTMAAGGTGKIREVSMVESKR